MIESDLCQPSIDSLVKDWEEGKERIPTRGETIDLLECYELQKNELESAIDVISS